MRRQLISLIGVLIFSSVEAFELSEKIHQQLGVQGYFYGPTNPDVALLITRSREGNFLICVAEDQKLVIYELTKNIFPAGQGAIFVRCTKDGSLVLPKS